MRKSQKFIEFNGLNEFSGNDYRVTSVSKWYITASGIIMQSLKSKDRF